jgi:PilZ domain
MVVIMASSLTSQKERQSWATDPGRRRSMRVLLSVPIQVRGKNPQNQDFSEETRTLVVNAHGALISLSAQVVVNQKVFVSNSATHQTQECRVVYFGNMQAGKAQMGVEFLTPSPAFWQIDFPPEDWVVPEN